MSRKSVGSRVADFLKKENSSEKAPGRAVKEVVASQLAEAMKKKKVSKAAHG